MFAGKRVIQDRDHRLCEHHVGSLVLGALGELASARARVEPKPRVPLALYNGAVLVREAGTRAMVVRRAVTEGRTQSVMQAVTGYLADRTAGRREIFDILPDQARTCQKEL